MHLNMDLMHCVNTNVCQNIRVFLQGFTLALWQNKTAVILHKQSDECTKLLKVNWLHSQFSMTVFISLWFWIQEAFSGVFGGFFCYYIEHFSFMNINNNIWNKCIPQCTVYSLIISLKNYERCLELQRVNKLL